MSNLSIIPTPQFILIVAQGWTHGANVNMKSRTTLNFQTKSIPQKMCPPGHVSSVTEACAHSARVPGTRTKICLGITHVSSNLRTSSERSGLFGGVRSRVPESGYVLVWFSTSHALM